MSMEFAELIAKLTNQEQKQVPGFNNIVFLAPPGSPQERLLSDESAMQELMGLAMKAGTFDWLAAEQEKLRSLKDEEAASSEQ